MKMKISTLHFVIVATLILIGCGSALAQDVRYNFIPGTDFSKYKTYEWVRVPNQKYPQQIVDEQIMQAIDSQLAMKGLRKANGGTPDLYVTYQVAIDQQTEWNAYSTGGVGFYGRRGMGTTTAISSTINVGTLELDFYDFSAKKQVWTGNATKQLDPSKDPVKNQKKLQKAMAKLLKNFPPKAK